jgi:hypothetical protein
LPSDERRRPRDNFGNSIDGRQFVAGARNRGIIFDGILAAGRLLPDLIAKWLARSLRRWQCIAVGHRAIN